MNYIKHLLVLISTISGCVSISAFVSLVFKNLYNNKKKKDDKLLSLAKSKLNSAKVLISKALIDN